MSKQLFNTWARLGVWFNVPISKELVDLEKTIIATCDAGRDEPRLLFGMQAWLHKHHDLVNINRLIQLIKKQNTSAVLGALIEFVLQSQPRSALGSVVKYCQPLKKAEFLFLVVSQSQIDAKINRLENLETWKKWNLISRETTTMQDTILDKSYVLKHNPNLALRALFGAGTRAEILTYFLKNKKGNALEISKNLGQSYQPIYSELMALCHIGLGKQKKQGVSRIFKIDNQTIVALTKPLTNP